MDLSYWKRPLYQLSHNHCPTLRFIKNVGLKFLESVWGASESENYISEFFKSFESEKQTKEEISVSRRPNYSFNISTYTTMNAQ